MVEKKGFEWGHLLLGILFVVSALIAFANPASSLVAVVVVFAITAIVKGIIELSFRRPLRLFGGYYSKSLIAMGVLDIIFGIVLLFNLNVGLAVLPYFFAIWFIIDSVEELFLAKSYKAFGNGYYWFMLITNILCVVLGIMLLFNPVTSALSLAFLIGFYFMVTGITYIIAAF